MLIIGGGPAGIELAGEIKTDHPGKMVTLVHSGPALMAGGMSGSALSAHLSQLLTKRLSKMGVMVQTGAKMPKNAEGDWVADPDIFSCLSDKLSVKLMERLMKLGVRVETDARVPRNPAGEYESPDVDVIYDCTGSRPATGWAAAPGSAVRVDEDGYVLVKPTLGISRQIGRATIYALGDCAATGDLKQGSVAKTSHIPLVVHNILASVSGRKLKKLKPSPKDRMLISIGRHDGAVHFPGGRVWTGCLPRCMKSNNLLVKRTSAFLPRCAVGAVRGD